MSVAASAWAWRQMGLFRRPEPKLVLLALADHADPWGECYPSRRRLGAMCGGISPRAVSRHVATFEELGLLERVERHRENGSRTSTLYRLKVSRGGATSVKGGEGESVKARTVKEPSIENGKVNRETEQRLFELWRDSTGRDESRTKFTDGRRRSLRARLKEYSAEEIAQAIRNCAADDWHVENGHTDLALICRNGEKLERFRDMGGGGEDAAWEAFLS